MEGNRLNTMNDSYYLISAIGEYDNTGYGNGGLFLLHKNKFTQIYDYDTTGLFFFDGEAYCYIRALKQLIKFSDKGIVATYKIRDTKDVHDIYIKENEWILVSTGTNEVIWLDKGGKFKKKWTPGGKGDAWHMNCLFVDSNNLYVTAFGQFNAHREWKNNMKGKGILYCITTDKIVITGLNGPHTPRKIGNGWLICDSLNSSIIVYNELECTKKTIELDGFTRGMFLNNEELIVGISGNRNTRTTNGKILFIDRHTLDINRELEFPLPEIYDIIEVSKEIGQAILKSPDKFQICLKPEIVNLLEMKIEYRDKKIKNLQNQITGYQKTIKERVINKISRIIKNNKA